MIQLIDTETNEDLIINKSLESSPPEATFLIELNSGNFLKDFKSMLAKLPSPGPSSTILKFFGFPNVSLEQTCTGKVMQKVLKSLQNGKES